MQSWKFLNDKTTVNASGNGRTIDVSGNITVGLFSKGSTGYLFDKKYIFEAHRDDMASGHVPVLVPKSQVKDFEEEDNQYGKWLYTDVKKVIIPVGTFKAGSPSFQVSKGGFKFTLWQNDLEILKVV